MNTLTKNRILQEGDEYIVKGGTWHPVPEEDYGLQIMFTKYAEVRRPSEKPFPVPVVERPSNDSHPAPTRAEVQTSEGVKRENRTKLAAGKTLLEQVNGMNTRYGKPISPPKPLRNCEGCNYDITEYPADVKFCSDCVSATIISPDSEKPEAVAQHSAVVTAKAEKENSTLAPTPSGAGGTSHTPESDRALINSVPGSALITPEIQAALDREIARQPKLIPVGTPKGENTYIKLAFPKPDPTDLVAMSLQPMWTGRNGSFTGYGLEGMVVNENIMFSPIGKRGVGNCCIQFPISVIPEIVEWLQQQTPK